MITAIVLQDSATPIITQKTSDSLYCSTVNYHWFMNGIAMNIHSQVIGVNQAGKYTVKANSNGCLFAISETFAFEKLTTAIEEQPNLKVNIYPNPTPGRVTLQVSDLQSKTVDVLIYDAFGRQVVYTQLIAINGNVAEEIDLTSFGKGMFVIKIQTKQGVTIKKMFIQ